MNYSGLKVQSPNQMGIFGAFSSEEFCDCIFISLYLHNYKTLFFLSMSFPHIGTIVRAARPLAMKLPYSHSSASSELLACLPAQLGCHSYGVNTSFSSLASPRLLPIPFVHLTLETCRSLLYSMSVPSAPCPSLPIIHLSFCGSTSSCIPTATTSASSSFHPHQLPPIHPHNPFTSSFLSQLMLSPCAISYSIILAPRSLSQA
jgi:hypothetical protein